MSAEKPEPGDVWIAENSYGLGPGSTQIRLVSSVAGDAFRVTERFWLQGRYSCWAESTIGLSEFGPPVPDRVADWRFWVNLPALLAGDPSAWAAALRFTPEVFLLEVGEGKEKHQVVGLPSGLSLSDIVLEERPQDRNGTWLSVKRRGRTYYADLAKGAGRDERPEHVEGKGPDFLAAVNAVLKGEQGKPCEA